MKYQELIRRLTKHLNMSTLLNFQVTSDRNQATKIYAKAKVNVSLYLTKYHAMNTCPVR
jgi:hypothetical protein